LFEKDLMDRIRDKFLIAEVPVWRPAKNEAHRLPAIVAKHLPNIARVQAARPPAKSIPGWVKFGDKIKVGVTGVKACVGVTIKPLPRQPNLFCSADLIAALLEGTVCPIGGT
jgi:hypothetical protein